ncbi:hypothetical protein QQF64_002827 [Cirrhinus molitorella]|uniref:ribonuclease H n=1 Tax=Cirrhinus molitorella TaxID=172907 RepID=A0ABR3MR87_9TELE
MMPIAPPAQSVTAYGGNALEVQVPPTSFGINLAQDEFQRRVNETYKGIKGVAAIVDDILVLGRDKEEHDTNLRAMLQRTRERGLKQNTDKCCVGIQEVSYFGHRLSCEGISPDPQKVKAIQEMQPPESKPELETLHGMVNSLARFTLHLSEVNAPLRQLLKQDSVIAKLKTALVRHGISERVISDNGPCYSAEEFHRFKVAWDFQHTTTSPRYPQSNGLAEKTVQTAKRILGKLVHDSSLKSPLSMYFGIGEEHVNTDNSYTTTVQPKQAGRKRTAKSSSPRSAKKSKQPTQSTPSPPRSHTADNSDKILQAVQSLSETVKGLESRLDTFERASTRHSPGLTQPASSSTSFLDRNLFPGPSQPLTAHHGLLLSLILLRPLSKSCPRLHNIIFTWQLKLSEGVSFHPLRLLCLNN